MIKVGEGLQGGDGYCETLNAETAPVKGIIKCFCLFVKLQRRVMSEKK